MAGGDGAGTRVAWGSLFTSFTISLPVMKFEDGLLAQR
jgi:hypothetical protein